MQAGSWFDHMPGSSLVKTCAGAVNAEHSGICLQPQRRGQASTHQE
jgi:hypothetical protein